MARILLIHGVQSGRSTWRGVLPGLTGAGHEVVTAELLGHGERGPAGRVGTLHDLAEDVVAQADRPIDLVVGHSLGALVALTIVGTDPAFASSVVLEDPPALPDTATPADIVGDVAADSALCRTDPEEAVRRSLEANPRWSEADARASVANRAALDVEAVEWFLRTQRWDLQALAAAAPVPVRVLAARGPGTALVDPDRTALATRFAGGFEEIESGHSIHRDRPDRWLAAVLAAAAAQTA